jgi:hypothetical protein
MAQRARAVRRGSVPTGTIAAMRYFPGYDPAPDQVRDFVAALHAT